MCDIRHLSADAPRLLCSVPTPGSDDDEALLTAWVTTCSESPIGDAASAHVSLRGTLCTFSAPRVREPLLDFARYAGNVVLDLSSLSFIDTCGVRLLQQLHDQLLLEGCFLRIHDPAPNVERVLDLVGADVGEACHPGSPNARTTNGAARAGAPGGAPPAG